MKKLIKKTTAKRRTKRVIKVALQPVMDLIQFILEDVRVSNSEKNKMKKLGIQKQYLKSEAKSKKDVLQYKEMLLPEECARLQAEFQDLLQQIKANTDKHNLVMGKRANRRKRNFAKCAVMLAVCGTTATATYLMVNGAMSVLGY